MKRAAVVGVVAAVGALGVVAPAVAVGEPLDRPYAFEVDREVPPPGQIEFSFDGGGPVWRTGEPDPGWLIRGWAVSAQTGFLDRPFRLHTVNVKIFPVEQRETLALGGALAIGSVVFDARLPMAYQTGDRMQGLGDDAPIDHTVLGDLGLGARLRVMERDRYAAFVRGHVTLPTGNDFHYAGEAKFTIAWALIGRVQLPQRIVLAGTAGVRFRGREVIVADRLLGDELFAALGASFQLPAIRGVYCDENEVRLTAELHGVLGNDVGEQEGSSPAEVRFGLVSRIRPWLALGGRVGKGIDDQIGAPRFRAMIEVAYIGAP